MDKRVLLSFVIASIVCGMCADALAAVKSDSRNADAQVMPSETYLAMQRVVDYGIVKLPAGCRNVRDANFDRHEMAVLTLQAMKRIGMDEKGLVEGEKNENIKGFRETLLLKETLDRELKNMGMGQEYLMEDISASSKAGKLKRNESRKYKVSAEVRYNYVKNSGNQRWNWNDSRLRARLFLEGRINDDWHAFGMLEANKHFLSQHGKDDWLEEKRFYVRGLTGDTIVTAGWYGYMLGEGNIFDSSVAGATANFGRPVNYELTAGRTKPHGNLLSASASVSNEKASYGAGIHHYTEDDWGNKERLIWHGFYNYQLNPDVYFGAMYIGTDRGDQDNKKHGFVGTVKLGAVKSWKPGTHELQLKYYYQPKGTYIAHTMTGLADYMDGFRGPGLIYYRTLFTNVLFNMEYYMLKELPTGDKGNTWWTSVTYYF